MEKALVQDFYYWVLEFYFQFEFWITIILYHICEFKNIIVTKS